MPFAAPVADREDLLLIAARHIGAGMIPAFQLTGTPAMMRHDHNLHAHLPGSRRCLAQIVERSDRCRDFGDHGPQFSFWGEEVIVRIDEQERRSADVVDRTSA